MFARAAGTGSVATLWHAIPLPDAALGDGIARSASNATTDGEPTLWNLKKK
jgi:hypothetical protein